ncbi:MAG: trigger factor [Erysipelotrichales bacterium]|nr:trigger factor [Erysipelotrichales bacterium]
MKFTWEKKENSTGVLSAAVTGDIWEKAQAKAFRKIAAKVKIKGFREGQAPEAMVRRMVSEQEIFYDAIDMIANEVLAEGVKDQKLSLVDRPSLELGSVTKEEAVLKFNCTVSPDVELGDYKGLEYKPAKVTATAGEIKEELEKIRKEYTEQVIKEDGAVENGDIAVIDFEGFKDGVAFEGGKGDNYPLEIGSGSFIPGFEEQLVGMKAGEEKEINVTFPEEYGAKELAGKPAVFKVKVNSIKQNVVPELDDDLAKDLGEEGIETLKDLEKKIKKDIQTRKKNEAEEALKNELLKRVSEASKVEIPEVMIETEKDYMLNDMKNRIANQGIPFKQYLELIKKTEKEVREDIGGNAADRVKSRLVLAKIAAEEKLKVTAEDIEAEFKDMAASYRMSVDQIKHYVNADDLSYDLSLRKALDFIKDKAVALKPEPKTTGKKAANEEKDA